MAPIKPVKKFASTIAELYAICRLCWNSCLDNIADFTAYKTFYNALFVQAALAEVDAAEDMPSEQVRNEVSEALRVQLVEVAQTSLSKWRALRGYIKSSFATNLIEGKIEAAGGSFYEEAYQESWEDLQQLMNEGSEFIADNAAALTAGGMPAGFPAAFNADFASYSTLYNDFKDAEQDAEEGTVNRMNANNALYEKVQAMNADGQIIYETNPGKFDRFVFARVKDLVTPSDSGDIILGTVQNTVGVLMVSNAGPLPIGTKKIRMTALLNGPLEFGLSLDGLTPVGNTTTMSAPASTTYTIADFASTGTTMVVRNQNLTLIGEYKIEFLG